MQYKIINRKELSSTLEDFGVNTNNLVLADDSYILLDDNKADTFFSSLFNEVSKMYVGWQREKSDCDKFSRATATMAQISHAAAYTGSKAAALAAGIINYNDNAQESGHSVNIAITYDYNKRETYVNFYEPQTGKRKKLSLTEKQSAFLVYI